MNYWLHNPLKQTFMFTYAWNVPVLWCTESVTDDNPGRTQFNNTMLQLSRQRNLVGESERSHIQCNKNSIQCKESSATGNVHDIHVYGLSTAKPICFTKEDQVTQWIEMSGLRWNKYFSNNSDLQGDLLIPIKLLLNYNPGMDLFTTLGSLPSLFCTRMSQASD